MLSLYPWLSKAQRELSAARTRSAASSHSRPKYLQERVESIIAGELSPLIRRAAAGETLLDAEAQEDVCVASSFRSSQRSRSAFLGKNNLRPSYCMDECNSIYC
jgi:hypothetical protein